MSDIEIGSIWVEKKKKPKEFDVVVLSGDSLMVKQDGKGFSIPWYISDFLENHEPKIKKDMVSNPHYHKDESGLNSLIVAARGLRHFYDTTNPDFTPDEQELAEILSYVAKAINALDEMEGIL